MKKKLVSFVLAFVLIVPIMFALTACGGGVENHTPVSGDVYEADRTKCYIPVDENKFNSYISISEDKEIYEAIFEEYKPKSTKEKALLILDCTTEKEFFDNSQNIKAYYLKLEFGNDNTLICHEYNGLNSSAEIIDTEYKWSVYNGEEADYAKYKGKVNLFNAELNDFDHLAYSFRISGNTLIYADESMSEYGITVNAVYVKK